MKGDFYDQLNPKLEAFIREVVSPVEITRWSFDDWYSIFRFDASERIKNPKEIEGLIKEKFDKDLELLIPKEGCTDYIIDSMLNPGYEAMQSKVDYPYYDMEIKED